MCHSNTLIPLLPVATVRQQLLAESGLPFSRHLPAELIHQSCHALGRFFRQRLFSPAVTLWMLLTQLLDADHSCRQAVARFLAYRTILGMSPCSADTGGYCKARQRLPEAVLADLTRRTGSVVASSAADDWRWHGRTVKVVDGAGLSMPDTTANRKTYPPTRGAMFPVLRLVVVFSLAVGAVLDAAVGPLRGRGSGEVSLLRTLSEAFQAGDVWLADRLYSTFWVLAGAAMAGADVVMRMHAGRDPVSFRGRGHGTANRRVWWHKPQRSSWMTAAEYDAIPEWLYLRAVRVAVRQRGFRTRQPVLVTTLTDAAAYPADDLADLYRRRWQAELDLRSLKQTLQMDVLRGQSPDMVRKEVWGHLLAYNIIRTIMAEAARKAGVHPDELSFTGAWQTVNAFLPHLRAAANEEKWLRLWETLVVAVGRHRVGERPDRIEPRAVKRRPKHYPRLRGSRAEARARLRKQAKRTGKKR